MKLAERILEIRKNNGLTQEDFAKKLFVTRQAVSRWENEETTPSLETLKKISELFDIDANLFFDNDKAPICQSCAMPLIDINDFGTNVDNTVNTDYCGYCYKNGRFTSDRSIDEMIESNLKFLKEFNEGNGTDYSQEEARLILKEHLATLKRWKNNL